MRLLLCCCAFLLGAVPVFAQSTATLVGTVRDAETEQPVGFAQLLLEEPNRSTTTNEQGRFRLVNLPPGTHTLKVFRIGYEQLARTVTIVAGDTLRLTVDLSGTPLEFGEIVVEGAAASPAEALQRRDVALEDRALRQNLSTTIAETLNDQPGISMRSMGPAPARPVLRGLGGERLLVLEDGARTGDLSATSTDHAVVIEPLTAERIEVIRGPAALIYGPNTLGGAVNVVREYIPTTRPDGVHAEFTGQAASVNRSVASGLSLHAPAGPLALHFDGSIRTADDVRTPEGPLGNTSIQTYNASLGSSYVFGSGYVGASAGVYTSEYGIPGGFVGAHPEGVRIELERRHAEVKGEWAPPLPGLTRLEARGGYSWYFHQEFESSGSLGVEFGQLTYDGQVVGYTGAFGPFTRGAFGVWGTWRDYASGGFEFTPASTEGTIAAFGYQELPLGPLTLQAGARLDARQVTPQETGGEIRVGSETLSIRERTFAGVSASVAALVPLHEKLRTGVTLMRSLRMPGIAELYSQGPHLASYSFEVGNPDLALEKGWGAEATFAYDGQRNGAGLALFYNYLQDYIYPRKLVADDGTEVINFRTLLPVYQFTGTSAAMYGGEVSGTLVLTKNWSADASASYVHAAFTDTDAPVPFIPPLQGQLTGRFRTGPLTLSLTGRAAAEQTRVADDQLEMPTDGYLVFDAAAQYYFEAGGLLHTLDLVAVNLTNETYRDHLSRVREIMPEPGLNIRLLYKIYF